MSARLVAWLVAFLSTLLFAGSALAQISVRTSASRVEVGAPFQLEASTTSDEAVSEPRLALPNGVSASGPSVGTRTQVTVDLRGMQKQTSTTATWELRASKVGTIRVGPPSFSVGGRRVTGPAVTVEVVPQGTLPRAHGRGSFDPFALLDPFRGGLFPPGFGPGLDEPQQLPPVPEEFRVERATDPVAFLRAVVTPTRVVVGEQVRLRVYAYGGRGPFNISSPTEPTRADFLSYDLDDRSSREDFVAVPVGDSVYHAVKIYDYALFPLRAGKLSIGSLTVTFEGGRYRSKVPIVRSSTPLELEVDEPPLAGRPPGYRLGDVGALTLTATVAPQRVTAGDAVSIVAKLEGTGNLPTTLLVPQKRGVEWLDPTVHSEVEPKAGVVGGSRGFTYVVKLTEPGTIDLGELTLPFYDPKRREYGVARAALGSVEVTPNAQAAAVASAAAAAVGKNTVGVVPRQSLAEYRRPEAPFTDDTRFWMFLFGAPLAVALGGAGLELGTRWKKRREHLRNSPARLAEEALRAATEAAGTNQNAATAAGVERALFLAIEAGTGIRARGVLRSELGPALEAAGVPADTARATLELLDTCEDARFTGTSGGREPRELVRRAEALSNELVRARRLRSSR